MVTAQDRLNQILPSWTDLLTQWSLDGSLVAAATDALVLESSNAKKSSQGLLQSYVSQWSAGNFQNLPKIVLLSSEDISGARGAYADSTDTIYLNQDWLLDASEEEIQKVLTEELGHYLDDQLNTKDTNNDEGSLFTQTLFASIDIIPPNQLLAIGNITSSGQIIEAEFSTFARNVSFGPWYISSLGLSGSGFNDYQEYLGDRNYQYYYDWQTIVGSSSNGEYLTLPFDNRLDGLSNNANGIVEKYKTAAGFDMWTIYKNQTNTEYYTIIAPKIEQINFNGFYSNNNGGNPLAQISFLNRSGRNQYAFKAGGSDDLLISDPSLYVDSESANLFVAGGGTGIDTLFIPYTQSSRIALERNSLGLSRVRFNDANFIENQYITTSVESVSFVDKAWTPSLTSNYSVVNSDYNNYSAVRLASSSSFVGAETVSTGIGTTGNDLMVAKTKGSTNNQYFPIYDGGVGLDILGLFNFSRSQLTNIQRSSSSPSDWRLTFGTTILNLRNIEAVQLLDKAVRLNSDGSTTDLSWLSDSSALNSVIGTSLSETLRGGSIGDLISGLGGNDTLIGNLGKDRLDGGLGIDTASYSEKTSGVVATLSQSTAANVSIGGVVEDTVVNIENLTGGSASDRLIGDALPNSLTGNAGNDYLSGRSGVDRLTGGLGADVFRFDTVPTTTTSNRDLITDFSRVQLDKLSFSKAVYAGFGTATGLASSQLRVGAGVVAASNSTQRFLYDTSTGILRFDRDGSGSSYNALQVAQLGSSTIHPSLASADFQLS